MATTEEPVLPTEPEAAEPPAAEEPVKEENPPPKSTKTKKAAASKEPKTKKVAAPRKRNQPTHPPYFEVLDEPIIVLSAVIILNWDLNFLCACR